MTNSKTVLDNNVDSNNAVDLEVFENTLQYLLDFGKRRIDILSWLSFVIAVIITFHVYMITFKISHPLYHMIITRVFYLIVISLIIIKIIKLLSLENKDKLKIENVFIKKIGRKNYSVILIKTLFMNILNDIFILNIIFFLSFLISLLLSQLLNLNLVQLSNDVNLLILISIIFGIFQYYIDNYKKASHSIVVNSISKFISQILNSISIFDFYLFLRECGKTRERYKRILSPLRNWLFVESNKKERPYLGFREVPIIILDARAAFMSNLPFINFELYLTKEEEIDYTKIEIIKTLEETYKIYFEYKIKKYKEVLKSEDVKKLFDNLRNILFSNFIFFSEAMNNLYYQELNVYLLKEREFMKFRFEYYYNRFVLICLTYLIAYLLGLSVEEIDNLLSELQN